MFEKVWQLCYHNPRRHLPSGSFKRGRGETERERERETGIQWGRRGETQRELEREGGIERGVLGSAEESAGVEGLVFNAEGMEAGMSGRVRKHIPASMCMGTSSRVG